MELEDFANATVLHPLAVVVALAMAVWMLIGRRRVVLVPILVLMCFVSEAQRITVAGLDFTFLRLMILVGFLRIAVRDEIRLPKWNRLDGYLLGFVVAGTIVYVARDSSAQALIYRLGWAYEVGGLWIVCRVLLSDWRQVNAITAAAIVIAIPTAMAFIVELTTRHNWFHVFGGVKEITWIRNGKLRCQGPYAHPILAGVLWASLLPMMAAWLWGRGLRPLHAFVGLGCGIIVVGATASSTPAVAVLAGIAGFGAFFVRRSLPTLRVLAVVTLFGLHFVMQQPVWHLVARIDLSGGSTGYHRFLLLDGMIRGWREWWLLGSSNTNFIAPGFRDITNQFALVGVQGGLVTLALFVAFLVQAFRIIGTAVRRPDISRAQQMVIWGLGVALTVHVVSFFAVSYFGGQIDFVYYLQLALIAGMPQMLDNRRDAPAPVPHRVARPSIPSTASPS